MKWIWWLLTIYALAIVAFLIWWPVFVRGGRYNGDDEAERAEREAEDREQMQWLREYSEKRNRKSK